MTLLDILRGKSSDVYSIAPEASLLDVVQELVRNNCGSLIVLDGVTRNGNRRMVGIITERDILRASEKHHGKLDQVRVETVMSTALVTGKPTASVEDAMGLMTARRIRHLPVVEGDELVGVISIGDVVKAALQQTAAENHYLKQYIQS